MKTNNLIGKIVGGIIGTAMLAGTAYASPREDLNAIRNYVKANPTINGTIGESKMYGLRNGNMSVFIADGATWFKLNGKSKTYFLCDNNSDGKVDGMESSSPSRSDESFAEMDCLSSDGRDISEKSQKSYESIIQKAKERFGLK